MFITPVSEDEAEGDLAQYYRSQRASWGFLPNYAAAFSTRPDVAQAWNALNSAIRDGMDRRRFEICHHCRRPGSAVDLLHRSTFKVSQGRLR